MSQRTEAHWFLDRWCAELVVEDWVSISQAARRLGVSNRYVSAAVSRVYHCGLYSARIRRWARRPG